MKQSHTRATGTAKRPRTPRKVAAMIETDTACEHARVIRRSDRMFPYRCVVCDTLLTTGALPDEATIDESEETVAVVFDPAADAELSAQDTGAEWRLMIPTWTSAPVDYDGFGTMTMAENCGTYCGRTIRMVATPNEHLTWQRQRYASGLHTVADAHEWDAIMTSPAWPRENEDATTQEGKALTLPADLGTEEDDARREAMLTAAMAEADAKRRAREEEAHAEIIAAPTSTAAAELTAMLPESDAGTTPTPTLTVLPPLVSTDVRVQYLYDLLLKGEEAILEELRRGKTLMVRLPRTPRGATPHTNGTRVAAGSKMNPDRVREFRQRRVAGESLADLAVAYDISPLLAKNIDKGLRWGSVI